MYPEFDEGFFTDRKEPFQHAFCPFLSDELTFERRIVLFAGDSVIDTSTWRITTKFHGKVASY